MQSGKSSHLDPVLRTVANDVGWDDAVGNDACFVVNVLQKKV